MSEIVLRRQWFISSRSEPIKSIYEFLAPIAKGSFGTVFRAVHIESKIERAIKAIIKPNIELYESFVVELNILKSLDHPNIVNIIETFETENLCFIVLEYCSGGDLLEKILREGNFSEQKAASIMRCLFSAINHCHINNVWHLDLKPENCVYLNLDPNSEIKVIDFGLAKTARENDFVQDNNIIGTAHYIAPEVLNKNYCNKSDCWSLGVIMFMLLSGKFPFAGQNQRELMISIYNASFTFRDPVFKTVSEEAKDLISKLLVKDINHRLSVSQAFNHPWIQGHFSQTVSSMPSEYILRILNFVKSRNMKKAAMMYIASKLTADQINNLGGVFNQIDVNGDGFISTDELGRVISNISLIPAHRIDLVVRGIDFNQNGMIDYIEFITACLKKQNYLNHGVVRSAFNYFDKDGNGYITPQELKDAMYAMESGSDIEAKVERMIQEADIDKDGKIDYNEFLALLSIHSLSSFIQN